MYFKFNSIINPIQFWINVKHIQAKNYHSTNDHKLVPICNGRRPICRVFFEIPLIQCIYIYEFIGAHKKTANNKYVSTVV